MVCLLRRDVTSLKIAFKGYYFKKGYNMANKSDAMYTQRISAVKGHRQQDVPFETRDIKKDRKHAIVIKRSNNAKA